jgi:hypothetical protein
VPVYDIRKHPMVTIYIWVLELTAISAGHTSMSIDRTYLSVWPETPATDLLEICLDDENWIARFPSEKNKGFSIIRDLDADRILMDRDFYYYYTISGLKEKRGIRKWQEILASSRQYHLEYFNCCVPVVEILYCMNIFTMFSIGYSWKWQNLFPPIIQEREINGIWNAIEMSLEYLITDPLEQFDWEKISLNVLNTPWCLKALLDDLENYGIKA